MIVRSNVGWFLRNILYGAAMVQETPLSDKEHLKLNREGLDQVSVHPDRVAKGAVVIHISNKDMDKTGRYVIVVVE